MNSLIFRLATEADLAGILTLQQANLWANLSDQERQQGFLTGGISEALLQKIHQQTGAFVACDVDQVVGFAIAGTLDLVGDYPLIDYLNQRLADKLFLGRPIDPRTTLQYGPVCIDRSYRGHGILPSLLRILSAHLYPQFQVGVSFIAAENPRSYQAHVHKLGMTVVDEFEFNHHRYYGVAFSLESARNFA